MEASLSFFILVLTLLVSFQADSQLFSNFYKSSCPKALSIVEKGVAAAIRNETRIGASLLRLHFHDCFVNGCDGSILLDGDDGEKTTAPNLNSTRGFELIDTIKAEIEKVCPGVVSCADILTIAARDSVVQLGGPFWEVRLGRRDSQSAHGTLTNALPGPTFNLSLLISKFSDQNMSVLALRCSLNRSC